MLPPPPYGITNASGAPPSSSTISKTAVFWPCPAVRVDGVDEHVRAAAAELLGGRERLVEVAAHLEHLGAEHARLRDLRPGDGPGGRQHDGGDPGPRRIGRGGGGRVPGRGADHRLGAVLGRLRDGDRHAAILVGAGRIRGLPLEPDLDAEPLRQARRAQERRRALAERDHRRLLGHRQAGAEAVDQRDRHAQPSSATPRPEIDGQRARLAARLGQRPDRVERGADMAGGGLVGDDVEDGVAVVRLLHELGDRDALGGELVRDAGEHAGAVLDLEPEVERRGELARRQPLEVAPDGVVLEEAGAGRADDGDHVGDDRRRRLDAAGAGAFERDLADRVALQHDGVEGALDRGERVVAVDERRADPDVDPVADEASRGRSASRACRARGRRRRGRA